MITIKDDLMTQTAEDGTTVQFDIGSVQGFKLLSKLWIRSGWDMKYVYSFSWLGRPIIQLPEDMIRIQELIYKIKPDVVIETGVAHGGSLIFYASIFKAINHGRVVGIDIDIRPHNRSAIESHELASYVTLIEGSSTDQKVLACLEKELVSDQNVMVILDSNHSYQHVLNELSQYSRFVSSGSYIVACDGIMQDIAGAPRTQNDWGTNNPQQAVKQFLIENSEFELIEPEFPFNESEITERVTYWPNAFLRKI